MDGGSVGRRPQSCAGRPLRRSDLAALAQKCRMVKKLKLRKGRAFIPSRRRLAGRRPLGFFGDRRRPLIGGQKGELMEWARILAYITGTVDQELLLRNEYLAAENQILNAQLKQRLRRSDGERAKLGEIGHRLGRKALGEVATAALPDTILAWYRRLVARKFDGSRARRTQGRPPIDRKVEELIVRVARENRSWGYDRIVGALANLGHEVSDQTSAMFCAVTVYRPRRSASARPPGRHSFGLTWRCWRGPTFSRWRSSRYKDW
jgi:Homeodomain-like domain